MPFSHSLGLHFCARVLETICNPTMVPFVRKSREDKHECVIDRHAANDPHFLFAMVHRALHGNLFSLTKLLPG